MGAILPASFFGLGLVIGSFINVLSTRYGAPAPHQAAKWRFWFGGRSRCPLCGATLNWYELVPVFSFLAQLGKCRHCHGRISRQYPIIELLTAVVFLSLFFKFVDSGAFVDLDRYLELAIWLVAATTLIFIAAVDWRLFIIPDGANILLLILGIILITLKSAYANHLISALVAALFFGAIVLITRGKGMGVGDIKLAGVLGLLLGWPDMVPALMTAFIIGALFGIGLILLGKKSMKDAVPFGPFLVVGVFVSLFFGRAIFDIINL